MLIMWCKSVVLLLAGFLVLQAVWKSFAAGTIYYLCPFHWEYSRNGVQLDLCPLNDKEAAVASITSAVRM
ncbi:hypothetical protein OPV22_003730 [Ensete ventricosum]|uniref:Uncharacterized protein n=1 Tax=Ensete ventricosum TaxID=4639 RepID=A0AAV8S1P3_ENSVE|nr:hypothetical protein OPV22_003730 [Ensete ventricosum]